MKPVAYTCPNCGRTVPDWYKNHVCLPRKKDFDRAAKIDPGVALAKRLAAKC
jgi:hypothetical protein